jgi:3',5'-cyclic AMP phosphodiesterase CpdA
MKNWTQIIYDLHVQKTTRKWEKLYWAVDLHDTVITGKYNRFNEGATLFPFAKLTLDYLFNHTDHVTILWTSSYNESAMDVLKRFDLKFNYFNENPECPNSDLCDFNKKFYFNFLLDDKAGFDPHSDWEEIYSILLKNH